MEQCNSVRVVWAKLGDQICNLPIGDKCQSDRVEWFHNPLGLFMAKLGYSWLMLKQMGFNPYQFFWKVSNNRVGYGLIARDKDSFVLGNGGGFKEETMSVERVESFAFDESIKIVCKLNIKENVIFVTGNASLANRVKHHWTDVTVIGARIKEV
ncbi:hypothetical protein J1N35_028814 [Gossypium stocksii]|uniref:Uncharacterized protein n=1 Tax=Gossypium stocksii TaxID=47602 RepID=A0A9D3UWQ2_9ROSI|nr:hypothetical protein J1N35_028814 [Gossypium stocksii]